MSDRKKVTIVSTNLSTNGANRCLRLAQALRAEFDVEIVGTTFGIADRWGEGLWGPLADDRSIEIKSVRGDYFPSYLRSVARLFRLIDGDIIIACKPRAPSLGIALLKSLWSRRPLVLDIDDDELAQTRPGIKAPLHRLLADPTGFLWTRLIHPFHRVVAEKFVVSSNFQARYGGVVVPHPMDAEDLKPSESDRRSKREALGLADGVTVVGFVGTPSAQKGIEVLLEGIYRLRRQDVVAMIVGADPSGSYCLDLKAKYGDLAMLIPPQPLSSLSAYLSAVDIVALPQQPCPETWGQMPAKLTDAMAMAKPIIAADRADISLYLRDCGVVFESGNVGDFSRKLRELVEHRDQWAEMGRKAREYFIAHLTTKEVGRLAARVIHRLLKDAG